MTDQKQAPQGENSADRALLDLLMRPNPLPTARPNGSLGRAAGLVATPEPREGEAS